MRETLRRVLSPSPRGHGSSEDEPFRTGWSLERRGVRTFSRMKREVFSHPPLLPEVVRSLVEEPRLRRRTPHKDKTSNVEARTPHPRPDSNFHSDSWTHSEGFRGPTRLVSCPRTGVVSVPQVWTSSFGVRNSGNRIQSPCLDLSLRKTCRGSTDTGPDGSGSRGPKTSASNLGSYVLITEDSTLGDPLAPHPPATCRWKTGPEEKAART